MIDPESAHNAYLNLRDILREALRDAKDLEDFNINGDAVVTAIQSALYALDICEPDSGEPCLVDDRLPYAVEEPCNS